MYSLKIENTNGEIFELTHDFSNYYVTDVSGLTPPATTINTAKAGIIDGTFFNSASVEERNIVIVRLITMFRSSIPPASKSETLLSVLR